MAAKVLGMQQALGNQAVQHRASTCPAFPSACPTGGACHTCPALVQTKLTVNQPGDVYEQEADRVAEALMRMPEPQAPGGVGGSGRTQPSTVPPIVREVLRSPGQPLDSATRAFMEPRFRHDFSDVQIHTDGSAAASARAVNALAYTMGRDIVFAPGQYSPARTEGRRLLAHELTHVLQQSGGDGLEIQRQEPPKEEPVATSASTEATPTTTTTPTTVPTETATPVATDPAKLSSKTWWDANENKAPYTKSADISDLESDFQTKVNEFKGALDTAGASISIDTTKRPAERAYILHYAWVIAKDGFKASEVPAKENVDIVWDHGDDTKSKAGANEIITAAGVASTPSLTSNHIEGKAIDWTITWTTDLKIKKKDATETEIKSEPRNGGDPGNTELHSVGKGYGVIKGIFTKKDPPHWSSDGT